MHIKVHFSLTILNYTTKNKNNSITIVTISRAIHSVIAFSYLIDQSALIHCNISGPIFQSMIRPAGVHYTWFSTNHRSAACAERNSCLSKRLGDRLQRKVGILSVCFLFLVSFGRESFVFFFVPRFQFLVRNFILHRFIWERGFK